MCFFADPSIGDGRYANNSWLQELPKPITRTTWDNAALVSATTAQSLGVTQNDYVTLELAGRKVDVGVFIVPGHANDSVTLHLGYGRTRVGTIGNGCGSNAYLVRTSCGNVVGARAQDNEDRQASIPSPPSSTRTRLIWKDTRDRTTKQQPLAVAT